MTSCGLTTRPLGGERGHDCTLVQAEVFGDIAYCEPEVDELAERGGKSSAIDGLPWLRIYGSQRSSRITASRWHTPISIRWWLAHASVSLG
jgi:hypothetical protein